jgi:hypothetical protein
MPAGSIQPVQAVVAPRMSRLTQLRRILVRSWVSVSRTMYTIQLAHYGGKYSIERMLALEEYTRNTSLVRVILVVMIPPIFTASVLLAQEIVPLQDPTDGWKANWGFWVRVCVLGIVNGHEAVTQVAPFLNVPDFSTRQVVVYSLLTGVGLMLCGMAAAEIWVFPIPFFFLSLSLALSAVLIGLMRAIAGGPAFRLIVSRKDELRRLNNVATLETIMCAAYPGYQMLFTAANTTPYELPVILLLSVVKLVLKRVFRSAASHEEDSIPRLVIFTVDVFDSFYLATFMQRLAPTTLAVVMLVDVAESAIELHELHQRTRSILARVRAFSGMVRGGKGDLLQEVRNLLLQSEDLQNLRRQDSHVRSCMAHELSTESRNLLDKMDQDLVNRPSDSCSVQPKGRAQVPTHFASVLPFTNSEKITKTDSSAAPSTPAKAAICSPKTHRIDNPLEVETARKRGSTINVANILDESLEVLFTSECLVLTEYVEIIIPIIYALFLLVTIHLTSAQYHNEMEGVTLDNVGGMVSRMFVYASLEFLSFVVLAVITKRNCGIHVLYQLAFVLETQKAFVPSKLVLWILYTLTYRVTHFGKALWSSRFRKASHSHY